MAVWAELWKPGGRTQEAAEVKTVQQQEVVALTASLVTGHHRGQHP